MLYGILFEKSHKKLHGIIFSYTQANCDPCIQIYLKNLAKVRWKIETYILIFQTQIFFTKRINVQFKVDFTKDDTSNATIQTTPKKLSLQIFFF